MDAETRDQIAEVRNLHARSFWLFKHVSKAEAREGDVQTNDAATNALVYMRRIALSEAEEILQIQDENRPRVVALPPTSLIVRTLKRKQNYGD